MSVKQFPGGQVWWLVLAWQLCSRRWTTRWCKIILRGRCLYLYWFKKIECSLQITFIVSQDVVIAIDGSLFRFHPHFKNVMQSRISQMMGINFKFDLLLSEVLPSLFPILCLWCISCSRTALAEVQPLLRRFWREKESDRSFTTLLLTLIASSII